MNGHSSPTLNITEVLSFPVPKRQGGGNRLDGSLPHCNTALKVYLETPGGKNKEKYMPFVLFINLSSSISRASQFSWLIISCLATWS